MGFDAHGLNFLRYIEKRQSLGRVITIGRQHVHLSEAKLKKILEIHSLNFDHYFCEDMLLKHFNAESISSVDVSDREKPTFTHDMNTPLPDEYKRKFNTVLDYGSSEHIYRVTQALENYSEMLAEGGQIIHVLPADNFNGHGFWQFSPELFFSLYSEENGYKETEVFFGDLSDESIWYEVNRPLVGKRINISSINALYILVRTKLISNAFTHKYVQQSDYVYAWENSRKTEDLSAIGGGGKNTIKKKFAIEISKRMKNMPIIFRLSRLLYKSYKELSANRFPNLKKLNIKNKIREVSSIP